MPDGVSEPEPAAIVDHRVILFRRPALCDAFTRSVHARFTAATRPVVTAEPVPTRQAVRFVTEGDAGCSIELGADDLISLMIGYCVGVRIPIPARASKTVHITPQGVTIEFRSIFKALPSFDPARKREVKANGEWAR